ncbi:hypothetical protein ABOM_003340 [Aspergillus bombycis]|uniref:Amidohydrolase-related domain-containing protein n=1 Tax=Aspergillus bombycis TaxID=109264 RepID=A0A1F8A8W6_9EURO|nr:hypothetical protein ABOM_003340 [Aspergillus bombycis]OGM47805.1 hypothetical protein ABOM_003340 [Aspergillus bombycis]
MRSEDQALRIHTQLLIPGRGPPIANAAVVIQAGRFLYVGKQQAVPGAFQDIQPQFVPVLMPGMWDCHTHFAGVTQVTFADMIATHPATCGANNARSFSDTLMAGFTSVRDCGSFAIESAKAIEDGSILGPHVYGAGAAIGQTGGSCDALDLPADWVYGRQGVSQGVPFPGINALVIADGVDECRRAVRLQIRRGAACIKIIATGGVMSDGDDPKYRQFCDEELKTLVEEASLAGRVVAAHAHGKPGIIAAVKAGCATIEHGTFIDEECAQLMRKKGTMLVATRLVIENGLKNLSKLRPATRVKMQRVDRAHMEAYRLAVRSGVKIALGTDLASSDPSHFNAHGKNGQEVVLAVTCAGMAPLAAIEAATANGPETLGSQAPRSGQIAVGYDADMLGLDENPIENIHLLADPEQIRYIWKLGQLVKAPGRAKLSRYQVY